MCLLLDKGLPASIDDSESDPIKEDPPVKLRAPFMTGKIILLLALKETPV
jgi:hypothetical protein